MDSIEYQVTIKSANQKVDDYVTKCRSSWTVSQLKQHISETHINRPNVEDQRLIYAGNLLKDAQTLKQIFFRDSLCTELTNSSKTDFTIHLVCSQKSNHNVYNTSQPTTSNNTTRSNQARLQQGSSSNQNNHSNSSAGTIDSISNNNVTNNSNNNNYDYTNNRSNQASIINGIQLAQNPASAQTTNLDANQVNDIVANLMDSEQMRQQMNMFQELANNVAAQLINNLASSLTQTSLSSFQTQSTSTTTPSLHQTSSQQIPSPDISSMLNNIPQNVRIATPTAVTVDSSTSTVTAASQMIYAGNRIQTHLVDASDHGNNPNRNLNHPADNNDTAPRVSEQHGGVRFRLGPVAHQAAHQAAPIVNQPAGAAAGVPAAQVPDPEVHAIQHDVIDWVYYSIRALVLMAALYIHASILRLLFIFGVLAIAYFFNRRSARRNNRRGDRERPQHAAANVWHRQANNAPGAAAAPDGPGNAGVGINRGEVDRNRLNDLTINNNNDVAGGERGDANGARAQDGGEETVAAVQPVRLSFLKFCYLVITDFLASLVPE